MAPPRPSPLAVDAGGGHRRRTPTRRRRRPTRTDPDRIRPFWAHLDSPFTVGFLLTLGGLAALVLGDRLHATSPPIVIYIVFAMFAALGLDPVVKWLGRHNVKRPWAIAIVFLTFGVVGRRPAVARRPHPHRPDRCVHQGLPDDGHQLRELRHLRVAGGHLRTGSDDPRRRGREVPARPREHRGDLRRSAEGRRRRSRPPSRALLIIVVLTLYFVASLPGIKESFDAVRAGPQPAEGARA